MKHTSRKIIAGINRFRDNSIMLKCVILNNQRIKRLGITLPVLTFVRNERVSLTIKATCAVTLNRI